MAAAGYVIKNAQVKIEGSDISDLITEVTVHREYADVDATGMGSGGAMEHLPGLRNDSFTLKAKSSYGATGLDAVFEAKFEAGTEFEISVNPFAGSTSDTNPAYVGTAILLTYEPVAGAAGALSVTDLNIPCQGRIVKHTT